MAPKNPLAPPLEALPAVDPLQFLSDDEIKEFEIDKRWDLVGTGREATPTITQGVFIIHEHEVPKGQGEVILGVLPHLWQRLNPTAPEEVWAQLDPQDVAGAGLFDVRVGAKQPLLVENDYNAPTLSTAPTNTNRSVLAGTTWLSRDLPLGVTSGLQAALRTYFVPGGSKFQVLFRLMPVAPASPTPNNWVVPTYPTTAVNRIDGAGALVCGLRMPQVLYEKLKVARRAGLLSRAEGR